MHVTPMQGSCSWDSLYLLLSRLVRLHKVTFTHAPIHLIKIKTKQQSELGACKI